MTVSVENFKNALSRFTSGVTVVSTRLADGQPIGVTVSAFSSLSLSPPLVLVCLDDQTGHLDAYLSADVFAVNILSESQIDISNGFAFEGDTPPFEQFGFLEGLSGVPLLRDTAATLVCGRHTVLEGGDHRILVGRVLEATWRTDLDPLVYHQGQYRTLAKEENA